MYDAAVFCKFPRRWFYKLIFFKLIEDRFVGKRQKKVTRMNILTNFVNAYKDFKMEIVCCGITSGSLRQFGLGWDITYHSGLDLRRGAGTRELLRRPWLQVQRSIRGKRR